MEAVAKETWNEKAKAILENANDDSKLRFITDGNKKTYDGYAGMCAISATRDKGKGRPKIFDKNPYKTENGEKVENLLDESMGRPYAGCYVNATVELWPQNNKFGKTIRATLLAVQFHDDGDSFGSGSAKGDPDDFEDLSETGDESDLVA